MKFVWIFKIASSTGNGSTTFSYFVYDLTEGSFYLKNINQTFLYATCL